MTNLTKKLFQVLIFEISPQETYRHYGSGQAFTRPFYYITGKKSRWKLCKEIWNKPPGQNYGANKIRENQHQGETCAATTKKFDEINGDETRGKYAPQRAGKPSANPEDPCS